MLTAHDAPFSIASARRASSCTVNSTVGGSNETDTSDVAVIARSRFRWRTVTALTPDTSRLMMPRKSSSFIAGTDLFSYPVAPPPEASCRPAAHEGADEGEDEQADEPSQPQGILDDDDVPTASHRGDEQNRADQPYGVGEGGFD